MKTTCCHAQYELHPEIGQAIARGHEVEIRPEHLKPLGGCEQVRYKRCNNVAFLRRRISDTVQIVGKNYKKNIGKNIFIGCSCRFLIVRTFYLRIS